MTDKLYIITNRDQEYEVLNKLEQKGCTWERRQNPKPTEYVPSKPSIGTKFPYIITEGNYYTENQIGVLPVEVLKWLTDQEIVYDGRKGGHTNKEHIVPQGFIKYLRGRKHGIYQNLAKKINNHSVAIEDVPEVEKPKKWVVRSKGVDYGKNHWYVLVTEMDDINVIVYHMSEATKFDTKEEAQYWANSHQEVVQVEVKE